MCSLPAVSGPVRSLRRRSLAVWISFDSWLDYEGFGFAFFLGALEAGVNAEELVWCEEVATGQSLGIGDGGLDVRKGRCLLGHDL